MRRFWEAVKVDDAPEPLCVCFAVFIRQMTLVLERLAVPYHKALTAAHHAVIYCANL